MEGVGMVKASMKIHLINVAATTAKTIASHHSLSADFFSFSSFSFFLKKLNFIWVHFKTTQK